LTCEGSVKLWREDVSLTCHKLTAFFTRRGDLEKATCIGAVHVVSGGGTADAEHAHFDGTTQEVALTGKPRAHQGGSVLEGRLITLNVQTGELSVEQAVGRVAAGAVPELGTPAVPSPAGTTKTGDVP
jgi:lipopolysaccharide transport protein LptA